MREPVGPDWDADTELLVARDVRVRRGDREWLIHFRASAPATQGLILSDDAFVFLAQFGSGRKVSSVDALSEELISRFVPSGFLLTTNYLLDGKRVTLALDEILDLRGHIPLEMLALLEFECLLLYLLARENKFPDPICELGSLYGGSTIAIARGAMRNAHQNRVIAVDDHEWHRHVAASHQDAKALPSTFPTFERNLKAAGVSNQVEPIIKDTVSAGETYDGSISMLFVDASHALEDVNDDFQAWFPKLVSGGIIAFHDYGNSRWPDVGRAVDALKAHFSEFVSYQTLAIATKA